MNVGDVFVFIGYRFKFGYHEFRVGREINERDLFQYLVVECWIEVDVVGFEQLFGGIIVFFGFDLLNIG